MFLLQMNILITNKASSCGPGTVSANDHQQSLPAATVHSGLSHLKVEHLLDAFPCQVVEL